MISIGDLAAYGSDVSRWPTARNEAREARSPTRRSAARGRRSGRSTAASQRNRSALDAEIARSGALARLLGTPGGAA